MYKLEFLPLAKKDMDNIIYYISSNLKNEKAAAYLTNCFVAGAKSILEFPYGAAIYCTNKPLNNEYRHIKIKNFSMFYTINEKEKIITIVRVLYQKMDISNILSQ